MAVREGLLTGGPDFLPRGNFLDSYADATNATLCCGFVLRNCGASWNKLGCFYSDNDCSFNYYDLGKLPN